MIGTQDKAKKNKKSDACIAWLTWLASNGASSASIIVCRMRMMNVGKVSYSFFLL
jgi:hypothetical protein